MNGGLYFFRAYVLYLSLSRLPPPPTRPCPRPCPCTRPRPRLRHPLPQPGPRSSHNWKSPPSISSILPSTSASARILSCLSRIQRLLILTQLPRSIFLDFLSTAQTTSLLMARLLLLLTHRLLSADRFLQVGIPGLHRRSRKARIRMFCSVLKRV